MGATHGTPSGRGTLMYNCGTVATALYNRLPLPCLFLLQISTLSILQLRVHCDKKN